MLTRTGVLRQLTALESMLCYIILLSLLSILYEQWETHYAVLILSIVGVVQTYRLRRNEQSADRRVP